MKKRILDFLAVVACALLVACAGMLPTGDTFNDKAAAVEHDIQLVQVAGTGLLTAGKITVVQDQQIQAAVRLVHNGVVAAKALQPKDPVGAAADLELASKQTAALKVRTGVAP